MKNRPANSRFLLKNEEDDNKMTVAYNTLIN